ncbi:MAG: hypothetical protein ACOVNZ_02100 [Crocinitomicaceae bacterium]
MKIILIALGIIAALLFGLVFAGFIGAFGFAFMLLATFYLPKIYHKKSISKVRVFTLFVSFYLLGYGLMYVIGLLGAEKETLTKLELIKGELKAMGHNPKWVIISQKRNKSINKILPNAVSNSNHLYGKAIDIYVLDINGDLSYNQTDAKLFEIANQKVEKKNPGLRGFCKLYIYTKPFHYFTKHMIHIDQRNP